MTAAQIHCLDAHTAITFGVYKLFCYINCTYKLPISTVNITTESNKWANI